MDCAPLLRRVAKVELHCHLEGTVRAATFADLTRKCGIASAAAPAKTQRRRTSSPSWTFCLNSVDGSGLQAADKTRLRGAMAAGFDALLAQLEA